MWYKIKNGEIVARVGSLPRCTENVSGFDLLPADELLSYGYRPGVDSRVNPDQDHRRGEDIETVHDTYVDITCDLVEKTQEEIDDFKRSECQKCDADLYNETYCDIEYMGHTFQADFSSVDRLLKTVSVLSGVGETPPGFEWRAADNTDVPMTLAEVEGLSTAIYMRGLAAFFRCKHKKDSIRACAKISDIQV